MTASNTSNGSPKVSSFQRSIMGAFRIAKRTVALASKAVALVTLVGTGSHFYERHTVNKFFSESFTVVEEENGEKKKKPKKKVLILPLDRLKLVEQRKSGDFNNLIDKLQQSDRQPIYQLEAKELVDIIHKAAADPNITGLYADFGEGMRYVSLVSSCLL